MKAPIGAVRIDRPSPAPKRGRTGDLADGPELFRHGSFDQRVLEEALEATVGQVGIDVEAEQGGIRMGTRRRWSAAQLGPRPRSSTCGYVMFWISSASGQLVATVR